MQEETWNLIRELVNNYTVKIYDNKEFIVDTVVFKDLEDGTLEATYDIELKAGEYQEETTKIHPTVDEVELIIRRTINNGY